MSRIDNGEFFDFYIVLFPETGLSSIPIDQAIGRCRLTPMYGHVAIATEVRRHPCRVRYAERDTARTPWCAPPRIATHQRAPAVHWSKSLEPPMSGHYYYNVIGFFSHQHILNPKIHTSKYHKIIMALKKCFPLFI